MNALAFALELQSALGWGWVALAGCGAAAALAWLYRRLFHLYPRRQAGLLLALKTGAAVLLLFALLRPAWKREIKDLSQARVIVLLDDSRSMRTADGSLGAARIDEARRAAFETLIPALERRLPVTTLAFSDRVRALARGDELTASGEASDVAGALAESAETHGASGRVGAVVLVSDGGDEPSLPAAFGLNVPVYVLAVGSDLSATDDLRIERLEVPDRADAKTEFEAKVTVAASGSSAFFDGLGAPSLQVLDGEKEIAAQAVALSSGTPQRTITFRIPAGEPGIRRFELRLPSLRGEAATLNNTRRFTVEVADPSLRVLYFAPQLGQEFKAFRNAVKSDPGIEFTGLVRVDEKRFLLQGQREGDGIQDGFPEGLAALQRFRCVVLGGSRSADMSPAAAETLKQFVAQGGALVWLGGAEAFARGGWVDSKLAPLCPWQLVASEPAFEASEASVELLPLGLAHPIFKELETRPGSGALAQVSGLNRPGALRPGAQALLAFKLPSGERPAALATLHYGQGKVLGVATNGLWRWSQTGADGQHSYNALWRQAIRYLTGREDGGSLLKLSADRAGRYPPGARATVTARVLDRALQPLAGAQLSATLRKLDGEVVQSVPFAPLGAPGAYAGQADLPHDGAYRLQVAASDEKGALETREILLEVGAGSGEGARLAVNLVYLEALAAKTGGAVRPVAQAAELAVRISEGVKAEVRREEFSLVWDTPVFFMLYLSLMTVEWVARRRMNLI